MLPKCTCQVLVDYNRLTVKLQKLPQEENEAPVEYKSDWFSIFQFFNEDEEIKRRNLQRRREHKNSISNICSSKGTAQAEAFGKLFTHFKGGPGFEPQLFEAEQGRTPSD